MKFLLILVVLATGGLVGCGSNNDAPTATLSVHCQRLADIGEPCTAKEQSRIMSVSLN